MKLKTAVLGVLLLACVCLGLPVNQNQAQVKEKQDSLRGLPAADPGEYLRYLNELANSDPGKRNSHSICCHHHCSFFFFNLRVLGSLEQSERAGLSKATGDDSQPPSPS